MPLQVVLLLDSDLFIKSTGDEFKAAVALWCKSWNQIPGGSLPNDDKILATLSGSKKWKKVKEMAMRGWFLCADGRFYHKTVAENVLKAWESREDYLEKQDNKESGQKRWRERCKLLSDELRSIGITPPKGAGLEVLVSLLKSTLERQNVEAGVDKNVDGGEIGRDRGEKGNKGELTEEKGMLTTKTNTARETLNGVGAGKSAGAVCSPGEISKAMRSHGVMSNPGDPRIIALAEQGTTIETVNGACEDAKAAKPGERVGPAYVIAIIIRWATEAQGINVKGAKKREDNSWRNSDAGIDAKGLELGMRSRPSDRNYRDYADRIAAEILKRKNQPPAPDGGIAA